VAAGLWDRQRTDFDLVDPANTAGASAGVAVDLPEGWVISRHPAHPPLVSEADFIARRSVDPVARARRLGFAVICCRYPASCCT
jgi:hypothetical protein